MDTNKGKTKQVTLPKSLEKETKKKRPKASLVELFKRTMEENSCTYGLRYLIRGNQKVILNFRKKGKVTVWTQNQK